jgi:hypothetical protein
MDNNEYGSVKFSTLNEEALISSGRPRKAWKSFWYKKAIANKALIEAVKYGVTNNVVQLINSYVAVDERADP